jgi:hypothetical protein
MQEAYESWTLAGGDWNKSTVYLNIAMACPACLGF